MQGGIPPDTEWPFRADADLLTFVDDSSEPEGLETGMLDVTLDPTPGPSPDPDLDNAIVEFVEMLNARDLDGLAELVAADVRCDLVGAFTAVGVIEGIEDLLLRYPDLIATRADTTSGPVAALWMPDADLDEYRLMGGLVFDVDEDGRITCVDYLDEVGDDAVIEVPDESERPEWPEDA